MAILLPPTVHERLVRCAERVFVDGLVNGATVELHIDDSVFTATATGQSRNFVVPGLTPGSLVRARQDNGTGFSTFSPAVEVENANVPPEATPTLPEEIGVCSQYVFVHHATPGARIQLRVRSNPVGEGIANRNGVTCIKTDLRVRVEPGDALTARQIVCGEEGPLTSRVLVDLPALGQPVIAEPVFGCQNRVLVGSVRAGAKLSFESSLGDDLGSIGSCWKDVNVGLNRRLGIGEYIRARCSYDANPCSEQGPRSSWREVIVPDDRIKPEVLEAVIEGDQTIRVANQIDGAELMIHIAPAKGQTAEEFGPRPTSIEQEIALHQPVSAGNKITVVQTLCGVSKQSDPVYVQPMPPQVLAPVITPPLYACGQAIRVSNLHLGALVRVYQDGVSIGAGWAGLESSISIPAAPALVLGRKVVAIQTVGGTQSPQSDAVDVTSIRRPASPRVLGPVALGDQEVWVSGVTPGSHLVVRMGSLMGSKPIVGELDAAEPVVCVPITPQSQGALLTVQIEARLCDELVTGGAQSVIKSPCSPIQGDNGIDEETVVFGDIQVPAVSDGGNFNITLRGQFYGPSESGSGQRPLVIIAHGWHLGYDPEGNPVESFKGYGYMARHLVDWGMLVLSIDLQPVNDLNNGTPGQRQQFARAEIILESISQLESFAQLSMAINFDRIALIGHSMAGEAVGLAQFLNQSEGRGIGIEAVVGIAPTRWHPDVVLSGCRYMQIFGSLDQLHFNADGADFPSASQGARIYDHAQREKTLYWIYGLRHNPFNSLWVAAGDFAEQHITDSLPESDHQLVAKCLINAFLQDALFDNSIPFGVGWGGYLEGTVFPHSLSQIEILTSHSRHPRDVLDNFGDLDDQAGIPLQSPIEKATNSRGLTVSAVGVGLVDWEDVDLTNQVNSPHSTHATRLSWNGHPADYSSNSGGIARTVDDVLSIRIAQSYEDNVLNSDALPADVFLSVSDGSNEAIIRLGAVAQIPFPDAGDKVLSMMRTVRVPLDAVLATNPSLSLNNIQSVNVRLMARPTGNVIIDDIEFST